MQQLLKYFSRKNKVENRIEVKDNNEGFVEPQLDVNLRLLRAAQNERNDSLFLLPSIKNNIGNFRKLTHLEITYIEEMLNVSELIELIKVYNDCISIIVDTKSFKS